GLPKHFCEVNLPKTDSMIVLEDESGKEYKTKYLTDKIGLSSGWKGFSTAHNLHEGDVLVLHLIQPLRFKVYIIRSHMSNEMDVALSLLYLNSCMQQHDLDVPQENDLNNNRMICDAIPLSNHLDFTSDDLEENVGLEALNGIALARSMITFQQVTSIDNFSIVVNGLVLDSQLPQHLKTKYYELCCSQQMFLHKHLLGGQNCQLVIGMIREIINISDAIKASKITTPSSSFVVWHKKLKGLETWGMNVRFLLTRLEQLMILASELKSYEEARKDQDHIEKEKKDLEIKLEEVEETIKRLDGEIDSLNPNPEMLEVEFQELANAHW
ncbi:B3 domain-containing protein Os01g0234100-like, partial [Prosopis cineraria]|uniref:B3 domain-containing protein Os01g0234100-like n=1 Tax=Prosopis cineraria TaxID=364024 RepID=UPI00240F91D8